MSPSKSTRILTLLGIDSAFFFLELIVGYRVHSLALVADSFHMLNDVLSLCVGLWAVKVANQKKSHKTYTYGWQRAETLGALINGVFLVALCLSIFLEAIQRFVEPQEVTNPLLIVVVGSFGLLSNILGLLLFHDHGHSHGGHSHGAHSHAHHAAPAETDVESASSPAAAPRHDHSHALHSQPQSADSEGGHASSDTTSTLVDRSGSPHSPSRYRSSAGLHRASRSRFYSQNPEDILVHPASFRQDLIAASQIENVETDEEAIDEVESDPAGERTPLLKKVSNGVRRLRSHSEVAPHADHKEGQDHAGHAHGHSSRSHADLNMRGVFLHVMGDALGNVGVIASALFIYLTAFGWRFYVDPAVSLIITIIILFSALPLVKAASKILLQAAPADISIDDIKDRIEGLEDVVSAHHLHIWQLSDTQIIASLHVQVAFDFKIGSDAGAGSQAVHGAVAGSKRYMELARRIRAILHAYGIHTSTIQPEFCLDDRHDHTAEAQSMVPSLGDGDGSTGLKARARKRATTSQDGGSGVPSRNHSPGGGDRCLLDCGDTCGEDTRCCTEITSGCKNDDHHDDTGEIHRPVGQP